MTYAYDAPSEKAHKNETKVKKAGVAGKQGGSVTDLQVAQTCKP